MQLETLQKSLSQLSCPTCQSKKTMLAILRCDLGLETCLVAVACTGCNGKFEVSELVSNETALDQNQKKAA